MTITIEHLIGIIKFFIFFTFFIAILFWAIGSILQRILRVDSIKNEPVINANETSKTTANENNKKSNLLAFCFLVFAVSLPLFCIFFTAMVVIVGVDFLK
jgi:uncharacterized protein with PQ loop repeat